MFRNLSTDALGFWAPQNEQIELALSFGFKSIDFGLVDFSEQVESRGIDKARRLIDSAKIRVGAFRLPVNLEAENEAFATQIQQLKAIVPLAANLECTRSIVKVAPATDRLPMHENFELHRARLAEVGEALAPHNVRLGVGFDAPAHWRDENQFEFVHDHDTLVKLVDAVGHESIGFLIDCWQLHVCGTPLDAVRDLVPRTVYVQVADAPAGAATAKLKEDARMSPSAAGAIDVERFIKILLESKYEGPITPVVHFGQFQGRRRDQAIWLIGQALDEIWEAVGLPRVLKPPPEPYGASSAKSKDADDKESEEVNGKTDDDAEKGDATESDAKAVAANDGASKPEAATQSA